MQSGNIDVILLALVEGLHCWQRKTDIGEEFTHGYYKAAEGDKQV